MSKEGSFVLKCLILKIFDENIHSIEDAKKFAKPIEEWTPEQVRDAMKSMGIKETSEKN